MVKQFRHLNGKAAVYESSNPSAFTSPQANLGDVYFHSDLSYLNVFYEHEVTINHPSIGNNNDRYVTGETDYNLPNHNLGEIPNGIVVRNNGALPALAPIQIGGGGAPFIRTSTVIFTSTGVKVREAWCKFDTGIPAISVTYQIFLFADEIDPTQSDFLLNAVADRFTIGGGKFDTERSYLRADPASPDFFFYDGAIVTADVSGGGVRVSLPDGTDVDDGLYDGSFSISSGRGVSI